MQMSIAQENGASRDAKTWYGVSCIPSLELCIHCRAGVLLPYTSSPLLHILFQTPAINMMADTHSQTQSELAQQIKHCQDEQERSQCIQ